MKNRIFIVILISFILNTLAIAGEIKVKCKINGFDKKPITVSQISYRTAERKLISHPADFNGVSEFTAENNSVLNFTVSGINHKSEQITIHTMPDDKLIEFTVDLVKNTINSKFEKVTVIGNFNNYDFANGIDLIKDANGIYSAEIDNPSDTFKYQILGPFNNPDERSVNGSKADYYEYDGDGDFRSVIITREKKVLIQFNPADFDTVPGFKFIHSENPDYSQYFAVYNQVNLMNETLSNMRSALREKKVTDEDIKNLLRNKYQFLAEQLAISNNPRVKKLLLLEYINSANSSKRNYPEDFSLDNALINTHLKDIEPKDAVWQTYFYVLSDIIANIDDSELKNYALEAAQFLKAWQKTSIISSVKAHELIKLYNKNKEVKKYISGLKKEKLSPEDVLLKSVEILDKNETKKQKIYFYDILIKDYPKSWHAKRAKREFAEDKMVEVGKNVPDFKLKSLDDEKVIFTPDYFKGKYLFIDIWATWCGPCLGELPSIHKAWEKFKDKNFAILSISFDDKEETVKSFREKKWKMPWNNAFSKGQFQSTIADAFEVIGIPRPVLISPDGKIVAMESELRGENLEKTLEKFLNK